MSGEATVKQYMTGIVKQVSGFLTEMFTIEKPYNNFRFLCIDLCIEKWVLQSLKV